MFPVFRTLCPGKDCNGVTFLNYEGIIDSNKPFKKVSLLACFKYFVILVLNLLLVCFLNASED